jgi:hypothetical protein
MVRSLDGVAYKFARELISELTEIASSGCASVVMTGEISLYELSAQAHSSESVGYVLQGFGDAEFRDIINVYVERAATLGIQFDSECASFLAEHLGGNNHLLAWVFWRLLERTFNPANRGCVGVDVVQQIIDELVHSHPSTAPVFSSADLVLSRYPSCWTSLKELAISSRTGIPQAGLPSVLEFAGVAIRRNGYLEPSSPAIQSFLAYHFRRRRISDYYARSLQFEHAFSVERHDAANYTRKRPLDPREWPETLSNTTAFSVFLSSSRTDIPSLFTLFADGCKYLLGLDELVVWVRHRGEKWRPDSSFPNAATPERTDWISRILPQSFCSPGECRLESSYSESVIAWVLEGEREDRERLITLSIQSQRDEAIPPEIHTLGYSVTDSFASAYRAALHADAETRRRQIQKRYMRLSQSITSRRLDRPHDLQVLVRDVARELRALGYQRILISFYDPRTAALVPYVEECEDSLSKIAHPWSILPPHRDAQSWVYSSKCTLRVPDPISEPLVDAYARKANVSAFAVLPLLSTIRDEVVGTLHIERSDNSCVGEHEIEDLLFLTSILANHIDSQLEHFSTIKALDSLSNVTVLTGVRPNSAFFNRSAMRLFCPEQPLSRDSSGWRDLNALQGVPLTLRSNLEGAATGGQRSITFSPPNWNSVFPAFEGLCASLQDAHTPVRAAILHLADQRNGALAFDAATRLFSASDRAEQFRILLDLMETVERQWARLYLLSDDADRLEPYACATMAEPKSAAFRKVNLPRRSSLPSETWLSIARREPYLFEFKLDLIFESTRRLTNGLLLTEVPRPDCPDELKKEPGDIWGDVPLLTKSGKVIGKLTFNWREADEFSLFQTISGLARMLI